MSKALVHKKRRSTCETKPKSISGGYAKAANDQLSPKIPNSIERDRRQALISEHAYYLAEQRGFTPGHELDDWLTAERDVEQRFASYSDVSELCGG